MADINQKCCRKYVFDVVKKSTGRKCHWGHEESLGRLFICQHVYPQKCAWTVSGRGGAGRGMRGKRKGQRVGRGLVAGRQARGARTRVHRSCRLFSKVARPSTLPPSYVVSTTSATLRDIPKYVSRPTNPELALKEKKREEIIRRPWRRFLNRHKCDNGV